MIHEFDRVATRRIDYELSEATRQRHLQALLLLTRPRPPHRRRRLAIAIGAAILAIGTAGVATAASLGAFSSPVGNRNIAHCYTTADLGRADNHNDFGIAVSPDSPTAIGDAAAQAMEICTNQWAIGRFSTTTPTFPDYASGPATRPVPPLVACVLDNGEVGIFPGTKQTCIGLGLANAQL